MKLYVFILLATLSIVNAAQLHKRDTKFGPCPIEGGSGDVTLLDVKLSPDPIAPGKSLDVTISGKLPVDIPAGDPDKAVEVAFLDSAYTPIVDPFSVNFCDSKGIKCPVPKGTEFSTVVTVQVPNASDLPEGATIVGDVKDQTAFYGCALSDPIA